MQPDLLSTQREEEQPESLPVQELTQSTAPSLPEPTSTESIPVVEATNSQPTVPAQKKRSRLNFAAIGLAFLVFVLFLAVGWVGYWAYTLNTELTTTQGQLAALQAKHDKLQADYTTLTGEKDKLNADLTQTKTDLEKSNTDLATAQSDLDKSKEQNKNLSAQVEEASDLAEILYVMTMSDSESDILKVDRLITDSSNKELVKHWDTFTNSPSEEAFGTFLEYLVFATRESLR